MPDRAFLDTNILVYAFTFVDPRKPRADELLIRGGVIAIQTLNEFISVQHNKLKRSWADIVTWLKLIDGLCPSPIPMTQKVHYRAVDIAQRYGYHIYDSTMLATAIEASCTVFYTEELRDGHSIDGLKIRNPFV